MKTIDISIELDPVKDGIRINESVKKEKQGKGLVIATNGDYRETDMQETARIMKELKDCFDVDCMGKTDFVAVFNADRVIHHEGRKYLAGSVLIIKESGEGIELLNAEELEQAKMEFISRLVAINAGAEGFSAYEIG